MTFPKARLAVAACLFFGWIGFLLYQVIESRAIVLSKPQFMIAQLYVVVDVGAGEGGDMHPHDAVTVEKVLWSSRNGDGELEQRSIRLPDLAACTKTQGYLGEGKYLLPLIYSSGRWMIAPLPRLAGFPRKPATHGTLEAFGVFSHRVAQRLPIAQATQLHKEWKAAGYDVMLSEEELRIYAWTPDTDAQVRELIATKPKARAAPPGRRRGTSARA